MELSTIMACQSKEIKKWPGLLLPDRTDTLADVFGQRESRHAANQMPTPVF